MADAEWATTATATTPPSTSSRRLRAPRVASPRRCSSPRAPWRTRRRCALLCPPGARHRRTPAARRHLRSGRGRRQRRRPDPPRRRHRRHHLAADVRGRSRRRRTTTPPGPRLLEQTHMPSGGVAWSLETLGPSSPRPRGSPSTWTGPVSSTPRWPPVSPAARFAAPVTTVMSCLSKGLCAPVGSVLAGPVDVMERARVERLRLGGSMRQAGVIAAAGLVASRPWSSVSSTTTSGRAGWPTPSPTGGPTRDATPTPSPPTWSSSPTPTPERVVDHLCRRRRPLGHHRSGRPAPRHPSRRGRRGRGPGDQAPRLGP